LFEGAKKPLVWHGVFDGAQVILGTRPHDELRLIPLTDGDGQPNEITPVPEGAPRAKGLGEDEQALVVIQMIKGI
jgi:hypothetical protein